MARTKGSKNKVKSVSVVETSEGNENVAVTFTEPTVQQPKPQTEEQMIAQEDSEDQSQLVDLQNMKNLMKTWETNDKMTLYLKERFKCAYLMPEIRYKDSRFPKDERGFAMSVNRFYPALDLVVDKIPANWTQEMIDYKKWNIEQLGFKYCWLQDGEKITKAEEIYERTEPIKKKPSFEFNTTKVVTQFIGDMRLKVS